MTLSLRSRLFLAHVLTVVAALALIVALTARQERAWLIERSREQLERDAAHTLTHLDPRTLLDRQAAAARLQGIHGHRVTLIDSVGRVLGDSHVPRERIDRLENHAGRTEVRAALAGGTGHEMRLSESTGVPLHYVAVPVRGIAGLAVLRVAKPVADIARLNVSLVRILVGVSLVTLALVIALMMWLTGRHVRRITALEDVTRKLGAGDPKARARELPGDEVGRLGRAINQMSAELRVRLEALERERDQREQILAHMSDGVALVDAQGRVVHANQSLAAILDIRLPPAPGTPFQSFARSPELDDLLGAARRSEQTVELDLRLWAPQQRLVRATATQLGGLQPGAVLLVLHDLSEVELLNRVRQDFVANVSHELKTPLTSVRGYAETLLEGGLDDVEHREGFVRIIREQATRLQTLVEDLLSLAELERPDSRVRFERFDLREAVERQLGNFRDRAQQGGLSLELLPGPPQPADGDRGRIEQVVANLLDNAVKYTERGSVTVAVGGDERHAWCEVRDTGPGIPAAELGRIFERFYRVDKARSREKGGTGLGLSIVKHILALHGGEVVVESTLGAGSAFRFEIPRAARESSASA